MLAEECRSFINVHFPSSFCVVHCATEICNPPPGHQVFAVLFSTERKNVLKFHTFSGNGISPRLAELCLLRRAGDLRPTLGLPPPAGSYFSEYYTKHYPLGSGVEAKKVIKSRFSGMIDGGENIRGVPGASPDDVYLFSSGMQAIWRSHKLLSGTVGLRNGSEPRKVAHVKYVGHADLAIGKLTIFLAFYTVVRTSSSSFRAPPDITFLPTKLWTSWRSFSRPGRLTVQPFSRFTLIFLGTLTYAVPILLGFVRSQIAIISPSSSTRLSQVM
jgi:hypothetical protein